MESVADSLLQKVVQAWNSHDAAKVASLYTEDCVYESDPNGAPIKGREALKAHVAGMFVAIPDFKIEVKGNFPSATAGVAEFVMSGTPQGTLPSGVKATGKSISVKGCGISEFQGDLIKRTAMYYDHATILKQLGLMPSAPG
jgi:steroid delta-isomerase-like uncharacterized protein